MLNLSEEHVGEESTTEGYCIYCKQNTTWLLTVLGRNKIRFECTRCCKISRDLTISDDFQDVTTEVTAEEAT